MSMTTPTAQTEDDECRTKGAPLTMGTREGASEASMFIALRMIVGNAFGEMVNSD